MGAGVPGKFGHIQLDGDDYIDAGKFDVRVPNHIIRTDQGGSLRSSESKDWIISKRWRTRQQSFLDVVTIDTGTGPRLRFRLKTNGDNDLLPVRDTAGGV